MELLSPQLAGWIVVGLLLVWLTLGVHIGVALGLAGFLGIYLTVGPDAALAQIATIPFSTTNSFTLAVIPLFIAAARCLLRLLAQDPYDEPAHLALVRALDGAGRYGEASRMYRGYAARMAELGVEPAAYPSPED